MTDEPTTDEPTTDEPTTDEHRHDDLHDRLEHLDRRIQSLEAALEEQARGARGPHYYDSGSHPEEDDQTIAP